MRVPPPKSSYDGLMKQHPEDATPGKSGDKSKGSDARERPLVGGDSGVGSGLAGVRRPESEGPCGSRCCGVDAGRPAGCGDSAGAGRAGLGADKYPNNQELDRALEVTNIRFLHKAGPQNHGGGDSAWNVRWCHEADLFHRTAGDEGEYWPADQRNDPAVYQAGVTAKVQVVLQSKQPDHQNPGDFLADPNIAKAEVWAIAIPTGEDAAEDLQFIALKKRFVYFFEGESRDAVDPGTGFGVPDTSNKFVTFEMDAALPAGFNAYKFKYKFYIKGVWKANGELIDAMDGTPAPVEMFIDETAEIHVYTTIGKPGLPWFYTGSPENWHPWMNVLAFSGYKCDAFGSATAVQIIDKVAVHCFQTRFYDHTEGRKRHTQILTHDATGRKFAQFNPTTYVCDPGGIVNCDDQGAALQTVANIAVHDGAYMLFFARFGYVNLRGLPPGVPSNNPGYLSGRVLPWIAVPVDSTYEHWHQGFRVRSFFLHHCFVSVGRTTAQVADACVGPSLASHGRNLPSYLAFGRDTSTAGEQQIRVDGNLVAINQGTAEFCVVMLKERAWRPSQPNKK